MDNQTENIFGIFIRYLLIIILGLGNLYLFYGFLTPVTISFLKFLLSFSGDPVIVGTSIHFKRVIFDIIPACVAGAAFYLMFILVFSTRGIKIGKRLSILLISFALLFVINILRLVFLISIVRASYFNEIHWFLWNFVSVIFVVGIWVFMVYRFKLRGIPLYSDLKYLWNLQHSGKKTKRRKKH